jgi:glycosyltransferase involved in cell wall biosynthesis
MTSPVLQPTVTVVIATRGRPELLRKAIAAAIEQDYPGPIDIVVVFDQVAIDPLSDISFAATAAVDADSVVRVRGLRTLVGIANSRTPGLAGGRNTGILAAEGEFIAFCDDDDEWAPSKLRSQLEVMTQHPGAILAATGITIESSGGLHDRLPAQRTEFSDLLESRLTEIHPSSFLIRRADLLGRVGLVDEELPASYGEDYDLLLRATRFGYVVSVQAPLVLVRWNRVSFFSGRWQAIADGLRYVLAKYPEFARTGVGSARLEGQIAFALAALGERSAARSWALRAMRHDRGQLRAYAAFAIAARLAPAELLVNAVNRRGRGL